MEIKEFEHLKQSPRWIPERDLLPEIQVKVLQNSKTSAAVLLLVAAGFALLVINVWAVSSSQQNSVSANAPENISNLNHSYNLYQ